MMRRMLFALAIAFACPALAVAQEIGSAPPPRFTVSPFLGYAFSYTQKGTVILTDKDGSYSAGYERHVGGGMMPGVAVEYRAPGRFGASAALAYNHRGDESLSTDYVDVAPLYSPGAAMWFARAAVTMELKDDDDMRLHQPQGQLSLGPALVREVPDARTGRLSYNAFAVNGAATAELPLPWKGFSFRASFEDYMAYLPKGDVGVQLASDLFVQTGRPFAADLGGGATHLYVIQGEVAYHF